MAREAGQGATSARVSITPTPTHAGFFFPLCCPGGTAALQQQSAGTATVTWWISGMGCFGLNHP